MKSTKKVSQPPKPQIIPVPIHFKTPGRSFSQIGRKGNVALYSVYSDYFSMPDFALPYLLLGYELVVIKTNRNGVERYPRDEEFGSSGWSIPKSFSRVGRVGSGVRCIGWTCRSVQKPKTVLNRSATSEDCACTALASARDAWQASQAYQNGTKAAPKRNSLGEKLIANH